MQLRVAIAVSPSKLALAVSKAVLLCSMAEDIEVDISYYTEIELLKKNYLNLDLLFASYSFLESGKSLLSELFKQNSECYPVIVDRSEDKISNYLSIRPVAYADTDNIDLISDICSEIASLVSNGNHVIQLNTKQGVFAVSAASILYCTSYQKYVSIITDDGREFRKTGKLDDYVSILPEYMVRVHQSYLVNTRYIKTLDKVSWELVLSNEERIPVSKAYRDAVSNVLQKSNLKGQKRT